MVRSTLSSEIESCHKWLTDNKLSLHLGKTECILFGSKRKLKRIQNLQVNCNNHIIKSTDSVKYLGVNIDQHVSGEAIATQVIAKSNSKLKFLYRQIECLDQNTRKILSSALIQCHFDYCSPAWYSSLSAKLKHRLQTTQNKIIRFILKMGPREHVGFSEFSRVGYLNVENRVKQLRLNHMFKISKAISPSSCWNILLNWMILINTTPDAANLIMPFLSAIASCHKQLSFIKPSWIGTHSPIRSNL